MQLLRIGFGFVLLLVYLSRDSTHVDNMGPRTARLAYFRAYQEPHL